MDTFKTVLECAKDIDDSTVFLNCGGCAVFASVIGNYLEMLGRGDVKIRVLSYYSDDPNIEEARNNIKSNHIRAWNAEGINFSHVIVEYTENDRTMFFDSEGEFTGNTDRMAIGYMTVEEISVLASTSEGWNSMFNRSQIPMIKEIAAMYFYDHIEYSIAA